MLLKDIPGVLPSLADTAIARSKLWERDVSEIIPHQLVALRWLAIERGDEDVDTYFDHLANCLNIAAVTGQIPDDLAILQYSKPKFGGLLSSELAAGVSKLNPAMARAAIFGLEMDLPLDRIMTLSFKQANAMELTPLASAALSAQVRSISSNLAFWKKEDGQDVHTPIFGFANEVYESFGMSWNALRTGYQKLIPDHFENVDNQ